MAKHERGQQSVRIGSREITAHGLDSGLWADFYHNAMTVSWTVFVAMTAVFFVIINALFAVLYTFQTAPLSDASGILKYFYFSIETLATVGYGDMHPQTDYAHLVASVETFVGLFLTAVLTGLVFARFSRPRARFIFARVLAIGPHDGQPCLSLRLANGRLTLVSGATAKLWMMRTRFNVEGVRFRGFEELRLDRAENPFFALTWTLFHRIDEASPIFGMTHETLKAVEARFLVAVTGHDDSAAQSVHARQEYQLDDIRWDHRYADIVRTEADGRTHIDYRLLHDVEAVQPASASSPS